MLSFNIDTIYCRDAEDRVEIWRFPNKEATMFSLNEGENSKCELIDEIRIPNLVHTFGTFHFHNFTHFDEDIARRLIESRYTDPQKDSLLLSYGMMPHMYYKIISCVRGY